MSNWLGRYDRDRSHEAVEAFRTMGAAAVPFLTKRLSRGPSLLSSNMLSLIWSELAEQNHIDALLKQRSSAYLLGEIGPSARAAEVQLVGLTNSAFAPLRVSAQAALIKIRGEPIDWLVSALADRSDVETWYEHSLLTTELGPYAASAVPVAVRALNDTNILVQMGAMNMLSVISTKPSECVPAIVPFLRSPDVGLRQWAIFALSNFGTNAVSAKEAIRLLKMTQRSRAPVSTQLVWLVQRHRAIQPVQSVSFAKTLQGVAT